MPLKSIQPITTKAGYKAVLQERGKCLAEGKMSDEALLWFIYDGCIIRNIQEIKWYIKKLSDQKHPKFNVSNTFIEKLKNMFSTGIRPAYITIPNAVMLKDFNPNFSYQNNVIFMEHPERNDAIRGFIKERIKSGLKPQYVAVDAEDCCFYTQLYNRAYDYMVFAFDYSHVFLWYRPKARHLKQLFKVLHKNDITILHWGPGDEKAFYVDPYGIVLQKANNLQPTVDGKPLSLSDACKIIVGRPVDKGLTMAVWSSPPNVIFQNYIEYFNYLIIDAFVLFLVLNAQKEDRQWYKKKYMNHY